MINSTLKDFYDNLHTYLNDGIDRTFLCIYDQTEINYGSEQDCDVEWCNQNNIPCYNILRGAGCCVNAKGNLNIADIRKHKGEFVENVFLIDFKEWLVSKGLHVELNNNDILIDGFKVASAAGYNYGEGYKRQYTCIQISINQDIGVIKHACKKEMKKVPKGLSEYGITTEEVTQFVIDWFEKYDK